MEKYSIIKILLKEIIKDNEKSDRINKAVNNINKLVIHVYQFLQLFILNEFYNNKIIPKINDIFVTQIFNIFTDDIPNKNTKEENVELFNMLNNFRKQHYDQLNFKYKINKEYLNPVISHVVTEIITNIEINIKLHLVGHLKKFIKIFYEQKNFDNYADCHKKIYELQKNIANLKPIVTALTDFKIEENNLINKINKYDDYDFNKFIKYNAKIFKLKEKLDIIRIKQKSIS